MSVSRLFSSASNARAVAAAKSVSRLGRIDSLLTRLSTVSQSQELVPVMLERVLNSDPVLGQKLPVAIAAFSADQNQPIPGSVADAVKCLGYDTVRKIVQIVGLANIYHELGLRTGLNASHLLNQAVAVGVVAEFLATRAGQSAPMAFSSGVFANFGVPVLAMGERDYQKIASMVSGKDVQLHDAEGQLLNCTHLEVGQAALTDHGFPETVCLCAGQHVDLAHSTNLIKAVAVAESFAHQLGYDGGFAIVPMPFDANALFGFGCSEADMMTLTDLVGKWTAWTRKMTA